jgi:hypothetical protein
MGRAPADHAATLRSVASVVRIHGRVTDCALVADHLDLVAALIAKGRLPDAYDQLVGYHLSVNETLDGHGVRWPESDQVQAVERWLVEQGEALADRRIPAAVEAIHHVIREAGR